MNTFGSYVCSCRDGYQEEGDSCYDIDECQYDDVCQDRQECVNTEGGYHCVQNCPTGYGYVSLVIFLCPPQNSLKYPI